MLIMSVFTLISFGFYIAMNALTPVFLQKPVKIGGYGFSTTDNANCEQPLPFKFVLHLLIISCQSHSFTGSAS